MITSEKEGNKRSELVSAFFHYVVNARTHGVAAGMPRQVPPRFIWQVTYCFQDLPRQQLLYRGGHGGPSLIAHQGGYAHTFLDL